MNNLESKITDGLALLCDARQQRFKHEHIIRLFQLNYWLLGDIWGPTEYDFGATLIAAYIITKHPSMRVGISSRSISSFLEDKQNRALFDFAFQRLDFDGYAECRSLGSINSRRKRTEKSIASLNEITHFRLRLARENYDPSYYKAFLWYDANSGSHKYRTTKTKATHRKREKQEAFLYSASKTLPNMLELPGSVQQAYEHMCTECERLEAFPTYCAHVAGVLALLGHTDFAAGIERATGVSRAHIENLQALTSEERSQITETGKGHA